MTTAGTDPYEEAVLRRVPIEILAGAALAGLAAALIFSALDGVFVLAGGVVAALGFLGMRQALGRVLARDRRRALASGLRFVGLRFVLILLILSSIILTQPKKLAAFAAGFSIVVPVFLAEALRALSRSRSWKS